MPSISMVDVAKVHYGVSGSYYLSELAMASLLCRIPHPSLVLCLSCSVNLFGRVMRAILSLQAVRCMHKERKEGRTDEGRSSERARRWSGGRARREGDMGSRRKMELFKSPNTFRVVEGERRRRFGYRKHRMEYPALGEERCNRNVKDIVKRGGERTDSSTDLRSSSLSLCCGFGLTLTASLCGRPLPPPLPSFSSSSSR